MDEYFVRRARSSALHTAQGSRDADTHVGACVFDPVSGAPLASASNDLPPGVAATTARCTRPAKYEWMAHAEQSAVAACAREGIATHGCAIYCTHFPCAACAHCIVHAGISTVVVGGKGSLVLTLLNTRAAASQEDQQAVDKTAEAVETAVEAAGAGAEKLAGKPEGGAGTRRDWHASQGVARDIFLAARVQVIHDG